MVTICFAAKSPEPQARVIGLGKAGITLQEFEREVLSLTAPPDEIMPFNGLEPGDGCYLSARGLIRDQTWTWFGRFGVAEDPKARQGAWIASGVLLLNQACDGCLIQAIVDQIDHYTSKYLVENGRLVVDWRHRTLSREVAELSEKLDRNVTPLHGQRGLSANGVPLLYYTKANLQSEEVAKLIDKLQGDAAYQVASRVIFGPTPSFAEKLNMKPELHRISQPKSPASSTQAAQGSTRSEKGIAPTLEAAALEQPTSTPEVSAWPSQTAESFPSAPERAPGAVWGAVEAKLNSLNSSAARQEKSLKLQIRWLKICAFLLIMLAALVVYGAVVWAKRPVEIQNEILKTLNDLNGKAAALMTHLNGQAGGGGPSAAVGGNGSHGTKAEDSGQHSAVVGASGHGAVPRGGEVISAAQQSNKTRMHQTPGHQRRTQIKANLGKIQDKRN